MPESAGSGSAISDHQWDEIFDVVVVGSGGGALTAALLAARGGASTVVVEKDEFFGGTTAVSGGDMWIPNNRFVKDRDSREDALAYIRRLSDGRACDPELQEVYVDTAPEMFEYLLETTGYDSEPHIQLDDYYSVIGDRIPGRQALPAHLRGQALPGRRRARRGTRTQDRLRPVDPAAGDQLPRAAARPGRGRGAGHPPARGLAGQGRRADRPAAQGRDRRPAARCARPPPRSSWSPTPRAR